MKIIPIYYTRDTGGRTIHSNLETTLDLYPTVVEAIDYFPSTSGDMFQNMVNILQAVSEPTFQSSSRIDDRHRKPRAFGPDTHRRKFVEGLFALVFCMTYPSDQQRRSYRLPSADLASCPRACCPGGYCILCVGHLRLRR